MSDLISRQAAIEAVRKAKDKSEAHRMLLQLPPAQPSVSKTEIVGDVISRQAAINEILDDLKDTSLHDDPATPEDFAEGYDEGIRNAAAIVLQMPPAQPVVISKSENTTECEDAVSRSHFDKRVRLAGGISEEELTDDFKDGVLTVLEMLRTEPPVTPKQPGWTYIEEALPETIINKHTNDYQEYNCLCDFGDYGFDVRTYKFGNGHFWNGGGIVDKYVTAWQPLPEIPDALKPKPWEGEQDGV